VMRVRESETNATAAPVHRLEQPTRCRHPPLDCLGDQCDEIGPACCRRQIQHRVLDTQARWSTYRAPRSRSRTLSAEAPFASHPSAPSRRNQDVYWSRRLIDQVVQESRRSRAEARTVAAYHNAVPCEAVPCRV